MSKSFPRLPSRIWHVGMVCLSSLITLILGLNSSMAVYALSQQDLSALHENWSNWVAQYAICNTSSTNPGSTSGANLVWPFATKSQAQYQRVDQGWDIQTNSGGAVYAIAPGTIYQFAPDPGGFGNDYPVEKLDAPITGAPSQWVYYGHVHVLPQVLNQHVTAGEQIAVTNTTDPQNGSYAPLGWLEIGFAQPGTDAPVQRATSETVATQAGQDMKNYLINAQPGSGATSSTSGNTSCSCGVLPGPGSTAPPNQEQIANAQVIIGIAKTDNIGQNGALIGLMVGLDESSLLDLANSNVPVSLTNPAAQGVGSDHDSVGVFQQRPSTGWSTIATGTAADSNQAAVYQLMTVAYSAEAFFGSPPGSNAPSALSKGLQDVSGWQTMPPWVAAQTVQASGTASGINYEQQIPAAQALLNQLWNSSPPVALPVPVTGGSGGNVSGACG